VVNVRYEQNSDYGIGQTLIFASVPAYAGTVFTNRAREACILPVFGVMNRQPVDAESAPNLNKLPAKLLKGLAVMALVFAVIFFIVRSGAMSRYEQGPPTIEPGAHTNDAQQ
jgi:hypothetical protein